MERTTMDRNSRIIIIGAGVFGLSTALELAQKGFQNITVLDRHVPPVPDGSSVDISRVIRFDYADAVYLDIAYEAYQKWCTMPKYRDIFHRSPFVLCAKDNDDNNEGKNSPGRNYIEKTTSALNQRHIAWTPLENAADAKQRYPTLTGPLANPGFYGYSNSQAGWADAEKAIKQVRDECILLGVSFISGASGTVTGLRLDPRNTIQAVDTLGGVSVQGDHFVLAAGAWASSLVPLYNSTLSTAQVIGYLRLDPLEMRRLQTLPIYINFSTGWFNFPPHHETQLLKVVIHGWGYTRAPDEPEYGRAQGVPGAASSCPPTKPVSARPNFVPADGEWRLRQGLREILPELADRPFERVALCWYTDTPQGDFIIDHHPDYQNLLVAGGGSGHAFKFLPVIGRYTALALEKKLPPALAQKWRFRKDFQHQENAFMGDGSRGGPERRELRQDERARL